MTDRTIELERATEQAAGAAGGAAARAAGHAAAVVVTHAAEGAGKEGMSTSEFKGMILAILIAGGVGALQALSVIPSPVMPFAIALSAGIAAGGYAISRGQVKRGALDGAAAIARSLLPQQAAAIETGRAFATAIVGEK